MAKLRVLLWVCVCALVPLPARADDGGWLEWLEKMSGPRLIGVATDFHLFCLNPEGKRFSCERWFGLRKQTFDFNEIRHELDIRVGAYWKRSAERFDDVKGETDRINAVKLLLMYRYHPNSVVSVGTGAGVMPFFGKGFGIFPRGIVTPVSVIVQPFHGGGHLGRGFYLRLEDSYIARGFTAGDFGSSKSTFNTNGGEWNTSIGFGWDFRRR